MAPELFPLLIKTKGTGGIKILRSPLNVLNEIICKYWSSMLIKKSLMTVKPEDFDNVRVKRPPSKLLKHGDLQLTWNCCSNKTFADAVNENAENNCCASKTNVCWNRNTNDKLCALKKHGDKGQKHLTDSDIQSRNKRSWVRWWNGCNQFLISFRIKSGASTLESYLYSQASLTVTTADTWDWYRSPKYFMSKRITATGEFRSKLIIMELDKHDLGAPLIETAFKPIFAGLQFSSFSNEKGKSVKTFVEEFRWQNLSEERMY